MLNLKKLMLSMTSSLIKSNNIKNKFCKIDGVDILELWVSKPLKNRLRVVFYSLDWNLWVFKLLKILYFQDLKN